VRVVIFISDKVDFKTKLVRSNKEGEYILIKGAIHQEDKMIISTYTLNIITHSFLKQTLLDRKRQIDSGTIIVCDFNTPLSSVDKSPQQKKSAKTAQI
jgi:hypothetical protein